MMCMTVLGESSPRCQDSNKGEGNRKFKAKCGSNLEVLRNVHVHQGEMFSGKQLQTVQNIKYRHRCKKYLKADKCYHDSC